VAREVAHEVALPLFGVCRTEIFESALENALLLPFSVPDGSDSLLLL